MLAGQCKIAVVPHIKRPHAGRLGIAFHVFGAHKAEHHSGCHGVDVVAGNIRQLGSAKALKTSIYHLNVAKRHAQPAVQYFGPGGIIVEVGAIRAASAQAVNGVNTIGRQVAGAAKPLCVG